MRVRWTTAAGLRSNRDEHGTDAAPAILPSSQDLSVLRRQRAQDRLQGREAATTLRVRARQDRAEPDHCGIGEETARACAGNQARALPWALALCDPLAADESGQK